MKKEYYNVNRTRLIVVYSGRKCRVFFRVPICIFSCDCRCEDSMVAV